MNPCQQITGPRPRPSSKEHPLQPLEDLECRGGPYAVGSSNRSGARHGDEAAQQRHQHQHYSYEGKLAQFYADVEEEQRQRDVSLRQAGLDQCPGEAETMQQTKGEGDGPGPADCEAGAATAQVEGLDADQKDAERDLPPGARAKRVQSV